MMKLVMIVLALAFTHAKIPSEMMEFMDIKVHPCDDFYQYSCGGWLKTHELKPSDIQIDSTFKVIRSRNFQLINEIVQDSHPLLSDLWRSCMAFDKTTALGNQPLQRDLTRLSNARTAAEVMKLVGEFARTGTKAFIKFSVLPDDNNASYYSVHFGIADLTLPSVDYYSQDRFYSISSEYYAYINDLMKLSGFSFTKHRINNVADIVIAIEKDLAATQIQDRMSMEIEEVIKTWPITIGSYLRGLGLMKKSSIKKDFQVYVDNANFYDSLEEWVKLVSLDNLKAYIAFAMVHSRVQWLGEDFAQARFKLFRKNIHGQRKRSSQYSFCVNRIIEYFPDLIGKYYYMKAFNYEREQDALKMINLIKDAMKERISHSTWLDTESKDAATIKLSKVLPLIGQPAEPKSYPFDLSPDDYPSNVYFILSHASNVEMKKIGQPVNRKEWETSAAKANAFYSRLQNAVIFPAGILQPPFFNGAKFYHPARNFGAIGTVMGHELIHGFDTTGRYFDGDGNYRKWWTESSTTMFKSLTKGMIEQYSTFEVHGQHGVAIGTVNGTLTINENIADNGGVSLAWDAYHKYMANAQELIDSEGEQLFFLAFGQSWCRKTRDEKMKTQLTVDPHSPGEWRVNGVVMNNKDFAKVFKCKENARMNPIKKTQIW